MSKEIIFELETLSENIANDFANLLITNLSSIYPISLKKKIIACSIELIQNNLIHNNQNASLKILENSYNYYINIIELIDKEHFEKLKQSINRINNSQTNILREKYLLNLSTNKKNTGNGLLFCSLKSKNNIIIENQNFYKSEVTNMSITIKFNKT